MQWVNDGRIKVQNLITHRVKPSQCADVYKQIGSGSEGFLGVVFNWK